MLVVLQPFPKVNPQPGEVVVESHLLASSKLPGFGVNDHTWYLADTNYANGDLKYELSLGYWAIDYSNEDPNSIVLEYRGSSKKYTASSADEATQLRK